MSHVLLFKISNSYFTLPILPVGVPCSSNVTLFVHSVGAGIAATRLVCTALVLLVYPPSQKEECLSDEQFTQEQLK